MQCENCGERPAAIHLTQIVNNSVTKLHLCDECAADKGVHTQSAVSKSPLSGLLASIGTGVAGAIPPGTHAGACPSCGATLNDFRETGRLGCPECYDTFKGHLRDLLRRLHGSSHHMGKSYAQPGQPPEDAATATLVELRDQLRLAVENEQFELAAELRDRIRVLE